MSVLLLSSAREKSYLAHVKRETRVSHPMGQEVVANSANFLKPSRPSCVAPPYFGHQVYAMCFRAMSEGPVHVAFFEFVHEYTGIEVREAFQ